MNSPLTAVAAGLARCAGCGLLVRWERVAAPRELICSRCESVVHRRRPQSVARTWALVLAGYVFYIPANLFAMTTITHLGNVESDTILGGVRELLAQGWVPVAILIFVASITVPLAKLVSLTGLLISIQRRSRWQPRDRTRLFRVVERIGRWSMLDVFVLTLLIALVQLDNLMTVEVGRAGTYFGAVVVLTILAAKSFDPRLIWDAAEEAR